MADLQTEQDDDFLQEKKTDSRHLYRKIFLLVFAVAMLWQGVLLVDNYARQYYTELHGSFKMLLSFKQNPTAQELDRLGGQLRARADVAALGTFDSAAALEQVRRQNPQLADTMLLLGTHKMPAYIELHPSEKAMAGVRTLADELAVQYPQVSVHYNAEHARLCANAGVFCKLLRLTELISLLALLVFMFLVEAAPYRAAHAGAGMFSGILAAAGAFAAGAGLVYLAGYLPDVWGSLICPKQQILVLVLSGLLGWTFSKWQKF